MQFTTVRIKEKDYDIFLKSEKLVHSNQEHEKMFPSYLEVQKTGSYLFRVGQTLLQLFVERKKWIPAIWRQKMQFTSVRSKEKDYDIYLKLENWFKFSRSTKKMFPSYLELEKTGSYLF